MRLTIAVIVIVLGLIVFSKFDFRVRIGGPSMSLFTEIKASPYCPLVAARNTEDGWIFHISVTQMPSGTTVTSDRMLRIEPKLARTKSKSGDVWTAQDGRIYVGGQSTGIEVQVHFIPVKRSTGAADEEETFIVPFHTDVSGTKGNFKYEAEWKKA